MKKYNNQTIWKLIEELLKKEIDKANIIQSLIQIDNGLSKYQLQTSF